MHTIFSNKQPLEICNYHLLIYKRSSIHFGTAKISHTLYTHSFNTQSVFNFTQNLIHMYWNRIEMY